MWSAPYVALHCPGGVSKFGQYLFFSWWHASVSTPGYRCSRQQWLWYLEEQYAGKPHHSCLRMPPRWFCWHPSIVALSLEEVILHSSTQRFRVWCMNCVDKPTSRHRLSPSSTCRDPFKALISIHDKLKAILLMVPLSSDAVPKWMTHASSSIFLTECSGSTTYWYQAWLSVH